MNVLVTGGAGYIGSHTIVELIAKGHTVVVIDNLINSSIESLNRVRKITQTHIPFYSYDMRDKKLVEKIFQQYHFDAVIHFAGLKSVSESISNPYTYYSNNIDSTFVLIELMKKYHVHKIIFSSSATVYGIPTELPLKETSPVGIGITNPYGHTKLMIEQILQDISVSDKKTEVTILRYFNPIGAHPSGWIGEDPNGIPNNLLPYISQVAVGRLDSVMVYGNDYNTPDGTGLRDYIHVVDLAKGHVSALEYSKPGSEVYNLGTGKATSVLDLIKIFSKVSGKRIPYIIVPRREGDIEASYASPKKANRLLKWRASKSIEEACLDTWNWQSQNKNGYNSKEELKLY